MFITLPDLPDLDPGDKILGFICRVTDIDSRFVVVSVHGQAQENDCTKSWYNTQNTKFSVYAFRVALEVDGIPGKEMCSCNAYSASVAANQIGFSQLADYYDDLPKDNPMHQLGDKIWDILVTTMDGVQGISRKLVLVNTITDDLCFLRDPARAILALPRASVDLIYILDVALDLTHQHRHTDDIAVAVNAVLPDEPVVTPDDLPDMDLTRELHDPDKVKVALKNYPALAFVQDADRLDAMGPMGIARAAVYGGISDKRKKNTISTLVSRMDERFVHYRRMMKTKTGEKNAKKAWKYMVQFTNGMLEQANCEALSWLP